MLSGLHIYYVHLASAGFEHSLSRGSLMTTYITLLALLVKSTLGFLVPAMCNWTSCAQVHELPQNYCGDNRGGVLFSWLHIYYAHLAFAYNVLVYCLHNILFIYISTLSWLGVNPSSYLQKEAWPIGTK